VRSVARNCPLYKSRSDFAYLRIWFAVVAPYISFLLSNTCVWFPVVSAAASNGTHEVLIASGCGEKYTDAYASLLGRKMEHLIEVGRVPCSYFGIYIMWAMYLKFVRHLIQHRRTGGWISSQCWLPFGNRVREKPGKLFLCNRGNMCYGLFALALAQQPANGPCKELFTNQKCFTSKLAQDVSRGYTKRQWY